MNKRHKKKLIHEDGIDAHVDNFRGVVGTYRVIGGSEEGGWNLSSGETVDQMDLNVTWRWSPDQTGQHAISHVPQRIRPEDLGKIRILGAAPKSGAQRYSRAGVSVFAQKVKEEGAVRQATNNDERYKLFVKNLRAVGFFHRKDGTEIDPQKDPELYMQKNDAAIDKWQVALAKDRKRRGEEQEDQPTLFRPGSQQ